ncbi:MAG: DUF4249 domain-containing protein [Cyclobacteriaceae bacterium]|nr:DUF4249 domain-containing protein [Cyclobacteriaceae bacterium]
MSKNIYILLIVLASSFGCEKVVEIDIGQSIPQIVIEGLLTDRDTTHFVKVSRSIQFYEIGLAPVTDAIITVNGDGETYNYTHNPMAIDSMNGYYFSDLEYAGKIGADYLLSVDVAGVNYSATDTMHFVTPIDSLSFSIAAHMSEEDEQDGKIYQLLLYAAEPQDTEDFYQFQFYRDSNLIAYPDNIYVFSDVALGSSLNGLPSPVLFRKGEMAGVRIFSISREQYIFYTDLANLLNTDGGMFSPPPANPRNTFSNEALGLWQVSAISEDSIRIDP